MNQPRPPSLARRERTAIVATLRRVGPDAPTLCGDWNTRDLAAHLVVREGRPDAAPGILIPALAGRLEELRLREAERPWDELLERIDGGAPWYSPLRYADQLANAAEYLVHHEDVLRGGDQWTAREFDAADTDRIWSLAMTFARAALWRVPARIELRVPTGTRQPRGKPGRTGARMTPGVVVSAAPVDMLLWAMGRDRVEVHVSGDEKGIEALEQAPRGL